MALKVRDEGDILEANLRFHHALGVDHFVVTDNGSTDETPEILRRYADAGLAHVINEPGTDLRERGAEWLTQMARLAATELEADWVIHTDADEFWWPLRGHARGRACRDSGAVRRGGRPAHGVRGTTRRRRLVRRSPHGARVARAAPAQGRPPGGARRGRSRPRRARRGRGRAWRRRGGDASPPGPPRSPHHSRPEGKRRRAGATDETRLVWAPRWPLRILHFPVRSSAQFKRRTEIAIFEGRFPDWGRFRRLARAVRGGPLGGALRRARLWDDAALEAGIRDGRLVRDERFARLLPKCPDPLRRGAGRERAGGTGTGRAPARGGRARVRCHAAPRSDRALADRPARAHPRAERGPGVASTA